MSSVVDLSALASAPMRRWSRAEYERMVEVGLLGANDRVELLGGMLVEMSPIGTRHAATVDRLTELLITALARRARVRIQGPFAASDDSEPEPDLAIIPRADYDDEHPSTASLIIEVADTTVMRDRLKAAIYATASVTEYWIVNLLEEVIEVHTQPRGSQYATKSTHQRGERITLVAFADVTLAVDEILPKR
jgi:Uma2 family endonuclease